MNILSCAWLELWLFFFVEWQWTAFPNSSVVKRDVETTVLMIDSQSSFALPVRENTFWQLTYLPSWDWGLKWCVKSVRFWGSSCFVRVTLHAGTKGFSRKMPKVLLVSWLIAICDKSSNNGNIPCILLRAATTQFFSSLHVRLNLQKLPHDHQIGSGVYALWESHQDALHFVTPKSL